ncbi:hypothetical protein L1765_09095 [Microaerobacter geothermalis]|uniref:hypothetical protein n=1 Tax=Microaerobacter geothermalis TaxID=674972 RepID=UPI001F25AEAD|nr:hypothetical protein [Microaerobacter geothermalis]MCF6094117.1 hypothetical protein [Microaerobacter geothermalis]
MLYDVNGLPDIDTVLSNERKLGGVIEAEKIKLRSGEEFSNPVIISISGTGTIHCTLGFYTTEGKRYIVNIDDISIIVQPTHKYIKDMKNSSYKKQKIEEKLKYLKRLCEVNQGCHTKTFKAELAAIVEDIGEEAANSLEISKVECCNGKVIRIA